MGTCTNLQCKIDSCTGRTPTSVSGTVYDPAGKIPLYNVVVYVPNAPTDPIKSGASCDRCDSPISGQPVAAALTDGKGQFHMANVPSGTNIPLVIQIGKWRREIVVPQITACQDNPIADPTHDLLRLPRNQTEGHIPQIALSTGHADALDCLLRKIGIADTEFTNDAGAGRVHLYVGGAGDVASQGAAKLVSGAAFSDSYKTLFSNPTKMLGYDILILQCEHSQLASSKDPYLANMKMYADLGGKIFDEHLHSYWIRKGPAPWPTTGQWIGAGNMLPSPVAATIDTTFARGAALADWLVTVGASTTRGQISVLSGQNSVNNVAPPTQRWIYTTAPASTQFLSFNTPVEATPSAQCGRVVFTDMHVATGGDSSHPDVPFPMGCSPANTPMTGQEKALEFMFFDLSSCVQTNPGNPMVPAVPPPGLPPTVPPGIVPPPPPAPPPPPPPPPPPIQ